ncbi:hypothetical protein [Mycolicibacterium setense]|uniref:Lipoprotein n=1 Tax=Mycolicibacterium setense TaxID=431269 RepID=A0ABR4YUX8_9MYCO|nr:hypothetical protein [Mycolicibacterium setense]KHO21385.1 hypothetical protein QQ25_12330 [Mycolicibacterium setense]KHO25943.1 hypothetical protein QQ44_09030 [Mycolicibacterium setense]MCV7114554.1 hypothetical protein [Mycolicibacterium setense]
MMVHKATRLKLVLGGVAAAGSLAFAGLCVPAGVAFAAPGDPGGGGYANDSAGGGFATGEAGGAYSRDAAGGGYVRGEAGGGYATGDAGGAWFREACEAAQNGEGPAPIGCAS